MTYYQDIAQLGAILRKDLTTYLRPQSFARGDVNQTFENELHLNELLTEPEAIAISANADIIDYAYVEEPNMEQLRALGGFFYPNLETHLVPILNLDKYQAVADDWSLKSYANAIINDKSAFTF